MISVELIFDADFADIFEVRAGPVRKVGRVHIEQIEDYQLCFVYRRGSFYRKTCIDFSEEAIVHGKVATFRVSLPSKGIWKTCVIVIPILGPSTVEATKCVGELLGSPFEQYKPREAPAMAVPEGAPDKPLVNIPVINTDHSGIVQAYRQAVDTLRALLMVQDDRYYSLAAGMPLFMAIFGRDSIISAIQTKLLGTELMIGTLHTLAKFQARVHDKIREAEPGKFPHEVRRGELSVLEIVPHSTYYGSVDTTPLFIILLWEAYQWTGDLDLLRRFLPAAEAALVWIDRYGDIDGDGFVEYQRTTHKGLRNQGWKDSKDAIAFGDGTLAEGPIALVEVQAYVYYAKRKMADIYRLLEDLPQANKLDQAAQILQNQFDEAFWMEKEGYYAIALDGRKRQVDSIASNPGHCLWSGIVPPQKASRIVERLMAPDMFSGWGIKTLSAEMVRHNPQSYHNGSVWPHDNSIIAAGFARYGFTKEAREVALAILDAAVAFPKHVLPELFAGYPRRTLSSPVPYLEANVPQAWASGAIIYLLETLLGVTPSGDHLSAEAQRVGFPISLSTVLYRGKIFTL